MKKNVLGWIGALLFITLITLAAMTLNVPHINGY